MKHADPGPLIDTGGSPRATRPWRTTPRELPRAALAPAATHDPAKDIESAYQRGIAEGELRARREASQSIDAQRRQLDAVRARLAEEESRLAAREQALSTAIAALERRQAEQSDATEALVARLTALACGRVISGLAIGQQLVAETVRALCREFTSPSGARLLLNPADAAQLPAAREHVAGTVVIVADAGVPRGAFQWVDDIGAVDLAIDRQYELLCRALRDECTGPR